MSKEVNQSQAILLESAKQEKQTILMTQIGNEPAQMIIVKNVSFSLVHYVDEEKSESENETSEKNRLAAKIGNLMFGWVSSEVAQRIGVDVEIIHSIQKGRISQFSTEFLTSLVNKFENPEYSILLVNVREHLDFLYQYGGIVNDLRLFGVPDSEILDYLLDRCDSNEIKINDQTLTLLCNFNTADMMVRFVDSKHFEKLQRALNSTYLSADAMIFFSELSKIPLIERIEAKERQTSKTNSDNARKPRSKGVLDAERLFEQWNSNPNKYQNQATFVSILIKKELCKDSGTGRTWLKKFVENAENENRLNSVLKKKLPQKNIS